MPVTVTVKVPAVVTLAAAAMVNVVVQVGLQEAAENPAVIPAGSGDSENVTGWVDVELP